MLADAAIEREEGLNAYSGAAVISDSDEGNDSDSPIFEGFYNQGGNAAIVKMINFNANEFSGIWGQVSDVVTTTWNVGRRRNSTFKANDVMFTMLCVLKQGGQWNFLGKMFCIKGHTFERLITGFMEIIPVPLLQANVRDVNEY